MKQTELFKKEKKIYDEKYNLRIGDIIKLRNPILRSDIGKKYIITDFMEGFEDKIIFCRLLNGNTHYQFLKEYISLAIIIEDIEKVDRNDR